jgi:hypothetical protein
VSHTLSRSLSSLFVLIALVSELAAEVPISLELVTEAGFPIGGQRRWIAVLEKLEVKGIRIRSAKLGDEPSATNIGTKDSPNYRVVGVLRTNDKLILPGSKAFSRSDVSGIKNWMAQLLDQGAEDITKGKGAFGLTAEKLVEVHGKLEVPVKFKTAGKPSIEILHDIVDGLSITVELDGASRALLASNEEVRDELEGLSSGTALAAILRPLGLVCVPVRRDSGLKLLVIDSRKAAESWPIGWPPQLAPNKTLPGMFKFLTVEIEKGTLLVDALEAIGGRLETPILYDYNSLARHQIDLSRAEVSSPAGRTFYKGLIDRLLIQAKLKAEVRTDENGRPFFWVSTVKK